MYSLIDLIKCSALLCPLLWWPPGVAASLREVGSISFLPISSWYRSVGLWALIHRALNVVGEPDMNSFFRVRLPHTEWYREFVAPWFAVEGSLSLGTRADLCQEARSLLGSLRSLLSLSIYIVVIFHCFHIYHCCRFQLLLLSIRQFFYCEPEDLIL